MTFLQETASLLNGKNKKIDAICKYLNDDNKVIDGIFKDQKIRFSQPWILNDPVEGNPVINLSFGDDITNYTHYKYRGITLPSYRDQVYMNLIEARYNRYGFLSLSKDIYNYDMWNHYANAHKGFIIDFKQNLDEKKCFHSAALFSGLVNYVENYEITVNKPIDERGFTTYDYLNRELFLTKTLHWENEKEYRIIRPLAEHPDFIEPVKSISFRDEKIYLFDFDLNSISTIIFGAAMSSDKKRRIMDLTKKLDITYCQSLIDKSDNVTMYYLPISNWRNKENFLSMSKQMFLTDDSIFRFRGLKKTVSDLSEIPYYTDTFMKESLSDFISRKEKKRGRGDS